MNTVENQKVYSVIKADATQEVYGIVVKRCMFEAMNNLKYNEFKIYMYMTTNQSNNEFALSTKDIHDKTGVDPSDARKCINGLIEKGYLVLDKGNKYFFKEDLQGELPRVNLTPQGESPRGVGVKHPEVSGEITPGTQGKSPREILQYNTSNNTINITDKIKSYLVSSHLVDDDFVLSEKETEGEHPRFINGKLDIESFDAKALGEIASEFQYNPSTKTFFAIKNKFNGVDNGIANSLSFIVEQIADYNRNKQNVRPVEIDCDMPAPQEQTKYKKKQKTRTGFDYLDELLGETSEEDIDDYEI